MKLDLFPYKKRGIITIILVEKQYKKRALKKSYKTIQMQIIIIVTSLIYTEYDLNIPKLLILITHLHIYMKIHTHIDAKLEI